MSALVGPFQNFFQLFVEKVIGNLNFGNKTLAKYSIFVLKNMVAKVSKDLKKKAKDNLLLNNISVKLFYINTSMLGDPRFYKLRSELFETISIGYLDDRSDDYIENSQSVFRRIMEADWPDRSQPPDLKRILVDFIGVFRGISSPKILIAFAKISYPSIQYLLNGFMAGLLNDGIFVSYLLGGADQTSTRAWSRPPAPSTPSTKSTASSSRSSPTPAACPRSSWARSTRPSSGCPSTSNWSSWATTSSW